MKKHLAVLGSFRWKVTLVLIGLMLFSGAVSNLLVYEYSSSNQTEQLRKRLEVIAGAIALTVDADKVKAIPLDRDGVNTQAYRSTKESLEKIKKIAPSLAYVYIFKKTDKEGILRFVIDLYLGAHTEKRTPAFPGETYDASGVPELSSAFDAPTADRKLFTDEWGVFLSGYAPIRDSDGKTVAVLGVDMTASDVYDLRKQVIARSVLVLIFGIVLSIVLGMFISSRVTAPISKLVKGTRHIASGDLRYRVEIGGNDEISELASSFNSMAHNLYKARKKLVAFFYHAIQSLIRVLEARDPYTKGHSDRVADFSVRIGRQMKIPKERIELLREGALLHDIGKLGVTEMILNKTTDLTDEERQSINRHPAIGEEILKPVSPDKGLLAIVKEHHERCDGKGYPEGLAGDRIDILASIVAVADSYDAMTSHRAYRKDMVKDEALIQLERNKGTQFNPEVVDAFVKVMGGAH